MNRNAWKKRYKRGYPSVKDCQLVKKVTIEIKEALIPQLSKFFQDFEVHFVKKVRHNWVGAYIQGSYQKPIVLLDMEYINGTCEKFDCNMYYAIETTIVHELGHAIEDWFGVCGCEEEVEEFARQWHWNQSLYEFWEGFENFREEAPEKQSRKVVASNGGK